MFWIVVGVVALVLLGILWRDLTRKPDPTALPNGPQRTTDGENVAWERSWDGVPTQGTFFPGAGPP